jgi:hypothetical protein
MIGRNLTEMGKGFETNTIPISQAEVCSYTTDYCYTSHEILVSLRPIFLYQI